MGRALARTRTGGDHFSTGSCIIVDAPSNKPLKRS
jgi:hypothetical protein